MPSHKLFYICPVTVLSIDIFDLILEIMKKDQQKSKHNQNQRVNKSILSLGSKLSGLDQLFFSCCIIVELMILTGNHMLSVKNTLRP